MDFDIENVCTCVNAEKAMISSKGYFANALWVLRERVETENKAAYNTLTEILDDSAVNRFVFKNDCYALFYPVEEPKKYRPYNSVRELLDQFDGDLDSIPDWVVGKDTGIIQRLNGLFPQPDEDRDDEINIGGNWYTMTEFYEKFRWKDGTKCGVEEKIYEK